MSISKSSLYILGKLSFIRCVFDKYFLPASGLSFHSLNSAFHWVVFSFNSLLFALFPLMHIPNLFTKHDVSQWTYPAFISLGPRAHWSSSLKLEGKFKCFMRLRGTPGNYQSWGFLLHKQLYLFLQNRAQGLTLGDAHFLGILCQPYRMFQRIWMHLMMWCY